MDAVSNEGLNFAMEALYEPPTEELSLKVLQLSNQPKQLWNWSWYNQAVAYNGKLQPKSVSLWSLKLSGYRVKLLDKAQLF